MIREFCHLNCEEDHYHIFNEWDLVDLDYEYWKEVQTERILDNGNIS